MGNDRRDEIRELLAKADSATQQLVTGYLPYEDVYRRATESGEVLGEATNTTTFARSAIVTAYSAR
jgi:hypothetical protein